MRLIDADELKGKAIADPDDGEYFVYCQDIDEAPTVDAVPVVPCKGCERAERYERIDGTAGYYCGHPQNTFTYGERWDRVFTPIKEPDDFCSYGKRREPDGEE